MRQTIPASVIATVAEMVSARETHATLDSLFMYAGAPGDPPDGSKKTKALEWLRRINKDMSVSPLEVLGRLIEAYMDEDLEGKTEPWEASRSEERQHLLRELQRGKLQYSSGGIITGSLATPSASLEEHIRKRNIPSLNEEFNRALKNVESSPKESLSAACNILESLCKVYIEEQGLEMPKKQDLQPVWTVVRKDLALDPSLIEDQDLQKILTGLISIVDGVGALRTHASTAHGAGRKSYRVEPRHARLAIHAAHTVVLFVLETWDKRKAPRQTS